MLQALRRALRKRHFMRVALKRKRRQRRPPQLVVSKRYKKGVGYKLRSQVQSERDAAIARNAGKRQHECETVNPKKIRRRINHGVLH